MGNSKDQNKAEAREQAGLWQAALGIPLQGGTSPAFPKAV